MASSALMDGFLAFSAEATGFSTFELLGTGEADAYLEVVLGIVGDGVLQELIDAHAKVSGSGDKRESQIRRQILDDPKLGPIARNLIKMWFAGVWYEIPAAWKTAYGNLENDNTFTIRASAYTEGLLWKTIGVNPPGAKSPGYGSWADPPRIPDPSQDFSLLKVRR